MKNPLPAFASVAGFWKIVYVWLHDHPATGVVMPVRMMTVIEISKHLVFRLITDSRHNCQTIRVIRVNPRQKSPSSDVRPRLDDVDLPLHVGPFNILIPAPEHTLD